MATDAGRDTGADGAADAESPLIGAVRAGDTTAVRRILVEHRGPYVDDAAFCLAVRTHSGAIAQLLLQYGADPRTGAPGSLLPLREAVDSGSPALVHALLDDRILGRYAESELLDARDLARDWCETGVEAGLRRRTGSEDVVTRTRVQDDEYNSVDECTLDGMTVRDGHGAVLTRLEELLGARTPFEELMARATVHADQDHASWAAATMLLAHRRDRATWTAAAALRTHTEPLHRLFGAEVLRLTHLFDGSDEDAFAGPALDTFTGWSAEETDPAVLAEVLVALGEHSGPRAEAALLPHAGHHETRVRRAVARGLGAWPSPPAFSGAVRTALRELMRDPEAGVRQDACLTFADGKDHDPVLIDAMAALMDDDDRHVRVIAVYGLARHDDGRCVEGALRLGPPQPAHPDEEHYLGAAWGYERERAGR
ncbi:HEAT repeat domain-containing protein [Streptomyces sp. NBC_01166]|uniref:HEAT repeat domain-containing protein n=1 Tax=Streptomyces sp. NBC_01166 TaxID=2903755 RepID=UPI00386DE753|nr:HEAT repeat domain-containing protein [Streptomyces sp. NBC_01166]